MALSPRQQEILAEIGIPQWYPRQSAARESAAGESLSRESLSRESLSRESLSRESLSPEPESAAARLLPVDELDWAALTERVSICSRCSELASRRQNTVFGVGDRDADWMFVGEAPGADEDRLGQPFVGRAGQLLDRMLAALGLDREHNVYIANVIKCRPPGNRDPLTEERDACREYLERQISLVRPRVLVALGRVAAQTLLATEDSLAHLRDRDHALAGIPLVVTYHPAYLLRFPAEKAKAWNDLCRAQALLGGTGASGWASVRSLP
jgi:uracil-DNA glycosylase family 4